jgi:glycosyltransferase involved in cell wall biosynthesis
MPRRLILVSEHYQPSSGATAQLMHDLSRGLADLGWSITVLTATSALPIDDADNHHQVVRLGRQQRAADATKSVAGKTLAGLRFLCSCFLWCSFRAHRNDLVFIVSNPPFIGLIGPLMKIVRRLPYLFLFQDLFPRSAVLSGVLPAQGFSTQIWTALMQGICRHSAATVVLNQAMAQRLQQESSHRLPLKVIHNWAIEQASASPRATNPFAVEYDFAGRFTIQYSGNFGRLHDINTLIGAAAQLRNNPTIQFLFIGGGAKQQEIQQAGLSNVLLLPYQPRSRLPETLAACDLACISLIPGAETTLAPCKLYGILASGRGLVLIACPNCDLAELVQRERIGIVVAPGDSEFLAQQLQHLSQQPKEVAAMGERAKRVYDKRFGFERSLKHYNELLLSL